MTRKTIGTVNTVSLISTPGTPDVFAKIELISDEQEPFGH